MKAFEYLFYKLFKLTKRINPEKRTEWNTIYLLIFFEFMNVIVMVKLFHKYIYSFPMKDFISNKLYLIAILGSLVYLNYYSFLKNKKFLAIERNFTIETNKERIIGNFYVILYVIISEIAFVYFWIF